MSTLYISINNTYKDTESELPPNDMLKYLDLLTDHGITKDEIIYNKTKHDLFIKLQTIHDEYNNQKIRNIILFIGAHGYENDTDFISGFSSNDNKNISITEILPFFDFSDNIYIFVDTCRTSDTSVRPNMLPIKFNKKFILVQVTNLGNYAFCDYKNGGFLMKAVFKEMDELARGIEKYEGKKLNLNNIHSFDIIAIIKSIMCKNDKFKIYANGNMMTKYEQEIKEIIKCSNQQIENIDISQVNVYADRNKIIKRFCELLTEHYKEEIAQDVDIIKDIKLYKNFYEKSTANLDSANHKIKLMTDVMDKEDYIQNDEKDDELANLYSDRMFQDISSYRDKDMLQKEKDKLKDRKYFNNYDNYGCINYA